MDEQHLIFFHEECPFCVRSVRSIVQADLERRFLFAPFGGATAENILLGPLAPLRKASGIVLVEHAFSTERRPFHPSKALLRIYWQLGGQWKLFGILSFLPELCLKLFYEYLFAHRHQFRLRPTGPIAPTDRLLP